MTTSEKKEDLTLSLTIFKNKYDVNTTRRMNFSSFDELEELFYALAKIPLKRKEDASLISPAAYLPGTTRKNINVVDWGGWACLDVDDWVPEGDLKDAVMNRFSKYRFVCYSTASSTHVLPKFRMVFPLTGRLDKEKIRPFWFALNEMAGLLGDKQVKDLSRMYYIPGNYRGKGDANQFIFSNTGDVIDPDLLMIQYPMPVKENTSFFDKLPPEMQEQVLLHRKSQMENISIKWNGINDCPFWPRNLDREYRAITNTGWYHKMYQIMVAVAGRAVEKQYPITPYEVTELCKELDRETGGWYKDRPLDKEAERAVDFVYRRM